MSILLSDNRLLAWLLGFPITNCNHTLGAITHFYILQSIYITHLYNIQSIMKATYLFVTVLIALIAVLFMSPIATNKLQHLFPTASVQFTQVTEKIAQWIPNSNAPQAEVINTPATKSTEPEATTPAPPPVAEESNPTPTGDRYKDLQELLKTAIKKQTDLRNAAKSIPRPQEHLLLSAEELLKYDGSDPTKPILLSIQKNIYDVTDSIQYYAKGQKYAYLSGHEIARGMATGCFESTGYTWNLQGLDQKKTEVVAKWTKFFSGKYRLVGSLKESSSEMENASIDDNCPESSRYGGLPAV